MKDARRLAFFGLIAVLLALTICSIGATVIVWQVSAQAREAVHMSDLYEQAHYLLSSGDSSLHEYTLQPDLAGKAEFRAINQSLIVVLRMVERDGDAGDRATVQPVLAKQPRYLVLAGQFFAIIDTHNLTSAAAFQGEELDPLFDPMDVQIGTAANQDHQIATERLADLDTTQRIVVATTALIFVAGLFLLILCGKVLHRYQQQEMAGAERELLRVAKMALTDPLTGLPNHRTMMDRIGEELAHCQRTQQTCALLFVDLDHFKHINDTWGHRAGDAVLREVGRRLKENVRQDDAVGRYGGEEFVLVLTDTDLLEAEQRAERLRVVLAGEPCMLESEGDAQAGTAIALTASIGVAVYQAHGTTRESLIEAADRAMYYAKQTGRNRVCLAGEETALMPQVLAALPRGQRTEAITVQTLTAVAGIHDGKTSAHAHRMTRLAEATARRLGRSEEEIHLVRLAALFHDIGKIGIPDAILHKTGPLTEDEWAVMRRHPLLGHHVLVQVGGIFELLSHLVVTHHERWDGQGYPYGLAQNAIPLGARILSVVDSYDAMTSQRPYRQPLSDAQARAELQSCAGSQYDPQVVEAFLQVLVEDEQQQAFVGKEVSQDTPLALEETGERPDRETAQA